MAADDWPQIGVGDGYCGGLVCGEPEGEESVHQAICWKVLGHRESGGKNDRIGKNRKNEYKRNPNANGLLYDPFNAQGLSGKIPSWDECDQRVAEKKNNSRVNHGMDKQSRSFLGKDRSDDGALVSERNANDACRIKRASPPASATTHGEKLNTIEGIEERLYYYMALMSELEENKQVSVCDAVCSDGNVGVGPYNPFEGIDDNNRRLVAGEQYEDQSHYDASHEDRFPDMGDDDAVDDGATYAGAVSNDAVYEDEAYAGYGKAEENSLEEDGTIGYYGRDRENVTEHDANYSSAYGAADEYDNVDDSEELHVSDDDFWWWDCYSQGSIDYGEEPRASGKGSDAEIVTTTLIGGRYVLVATLLRSPDQRWSLECNGQDTRAIKDVEQYKSEWLIHWASGVRRVGWGNNFDSLVLGAMFLLLVRIFTRWRRRQLTQSRALTRKSTRWRRYHAERSVVNFANVLIGLTRYPTIF